MYKISSYGMILGALALLISIFHFTSGPFSAPPTSEKRIADKVLSIKNGILAGLNGKEPSAIAEKKNTLNIDNALDNLSISLAIVALVLAFMGGARKENVWSVSGSLCFGGATLAFHAILFGIGVIFSIIILIAVLGFLLSFFQG